jgi:DNA-binding beta-propeller fold protein YncE
VRAARLLTLILALGCAAGCSSSEEPQVASPKRLVGQSSVRPPLRLVERAVGRLAQPLQDAAAAPGGAGVVVAGGLDASDSSVGDIRVVSSRGTLQRGSLTGVRHDAAAVTLGGATYVLGGGNGNAQLDEIVRIRPGATPVVAGHLPEGASDLGAAAIGGTAYVVGGFTGSRWLRTILAWRPGSRPRVVAHLPEPLRYAAVTAAGDELVIAGGSTPTGTASRKVLGFDPAEGRLRTIAHLPAPTTHAAAASIGDVAYVVGGRGANPGTPTGRIWSIDSDGGRLRRAGALSLPRSDLAAATLGQRILLVGGRDAIGPVANIAALTPSGRARRAAPLRNVYAAAGAGMLSRVVRGARPLVYVPNSQSNTVDEIDQRTFRIVRHFAVGALPQHVTPSYDLKTLYVLNDVGNSLTPINPRTGAPGRAIPVEDPYNLYFTPNGRYAIVVAERLARLDFRFPHTFRLHRSLRVPCRGIDHMDFSADGRYLIASCEFSGQLVKVDVARDRLVRVLSLPRGAIPQDVKLAPDGKLFYVADMGGGGVWKVSGSPLRIVGFIRTGAGTHGLYASRNARLLYATNRGEGSVSVISFATGKVVAKWRIPGGSPDMGNVSADGKVLWLSGRWNGEVYALSTRSGRLLARIRVGVGPHGLCVWPQPGRYSLGHTGILR